MPIESFWVNLKILVLSFRNRLLLHFYVYVLYDNNIIIRVNNSNTIILLYYILENLL